MITEHAVAHCACARSPSGWLVQAAHPPTAAQISNARVAAAAAGLTIETRSSIPSVTAITGWATAAGILLALCILAMSIGLIRSETASDLRILTATGATGPTRRMITAATAGTWAWSAPSSARRPATSAPWPGSGTARRTACPRWPACRCGTWLIILAGLPLAACGSRLAAGGPGAGRDRAPAIE